MAEKTKTVKMFVKGIGSYMNVFVPRKMKGPNGQEVGEPKYSLSLVIPKTDKETISRVKKAILEVATDAFGPTAPKMFAKGVLKNILNDGDDKRNGEGVYENAVYFNTSSARKPGIVDINRQEVVDPDDCYSGCLVQVSVTFYAYDNVAKGVSAGLNNIRVIQKGEHLDGRVVATEEEWPEEEGEEQADEEEETPAPKLKGKTKRVVVEEEEEEDEEVPF